MRRFNYTLITVLVASLGLLSWWSLERFETQDARARKMFMDAMFHWQNTNWQGVGDWPRAEAGFRQLLAEYPESQWAVQAAPYLVSTLMNQRNDTAALVLAEYYTERYRGSESEARLWFQQAQCLRRTGRHRASAAAWRIHEELVSGITPDSSAGLPELGDTKGVR